MERFGDQIWALRHQKARIFTIFDNMFSECFCFYLTGLMKPKECQVVLAGDPKQLGPIVTNRRAGKHGLG